MYRNYVFDLGNVLFRFDPYVLTDVYFHDKALTAQVMPVVFDRLYWDPLDRGNITDEEICAGIRSRLPAELAERGCEAYTHWYENMTPIAGMSRLTKSVKENGGRLFLLSNISAAFADHWQEIPALREMLEPFDGRVFSGKIHMGKPDEEIFRYLLDTYHLNPDETVFVDDSAHNVAGAESVGIHGYVFDGNAAACARAIGLPVDHVAIAGDLFLQGYNCSQAIFAAFSDVTGLDKAFSLRLSAALGGGVGRTREICGALSGAALVLSAVRGYTDAADHDGKAALYAAVQRVTAPFSEQYGAVRCGELLKSTDTSPHPTARDAAFYRKRPCLRFVENTAAYLEEELNRDE